MTLTEQLINPIGKREALKTIIGEKFCYLAIGTGPQDAEAGNGFEYTKESSTYGFNEVSIIEDPSYYRVKLVQSGASIDEDTGKATVTFIGELENDNIINNISISQLAIVDSADVESSNVTYYAFSTFPKFNKTEKTALTFELEFKM